MAGKLIQTTSLLFSFLCFYDSFENAEIACNTGGSERYLLESQLSLWLRGGTYSITQPPQSIKWTFKQTLLLPQDIRKRSTSSIIKLRRDGLDLGRNRFR